MNKVLLYACIEKNIGDDLFVYTICNRYPNCIFYISSEAKYGSLKNIKNLRFSHIFNIWQKASNLGNRKGFKLYISKILASFCSVYLKHFNISVYVVGNAFKCYNYKGKWQSEWFKKRVLLTKNFFLLSSNFGPYNDNQWVLDFKEHFRHASHICFRDYKSYELFKDLINVSWAPDVVLSLGEITHDVKDKNERKQILISIINCGYETRPENIKRYQNVYESKIVEICNYYLNNFYSVKILTSNNEQDYPAAERIKNECYNQIHKQPDIIEYNGNLNIVFEEYKKSDYIIGTRLHSIILAWLYKLPVVPIIYDIKVKYLLESYKFEGFKVDLESIYSLSVKEIDNALKEYDFKNLENLYLKSNKQFDLLDKLIL